MVVVDDLDEGLHLAALGDAGLRHAAGDGGRIALNAGYEGVREGMRFAAVVLRLENDDFLACIAAARNDGLWKIIQLDLHSESAVCVRLEAAYHSADLEDCEDVSIHHRIIR